MVKLVNDILGSAGACLHILLVFSNLYRTFKVRACGMILNARYAYGYGAILTEPHGPLRLNQQLLQPS